MKTTTETPCPHGPWPARECIQCSKPPSYAAPMLLIAGISAIGYTLLGAALILLGRLIWNVAQGVLGQ